MLIRCGGLKRTAFFKVSKGVVVSTVFWEGVVVLKDVIFSSF